MNIREIPCHKGNYGGKRQGKVDYLVLHYTAVPGDTAENEGKCFSQQVRGASAHYFVDEHEVVASVPEDHIAWHCGADSYRHKTCRNSNSLGIEICTKGRHGDYQFDPAALARAKALVRQLMQTHGVSPDRVLRHYDVTGKVCPAPFVGAGEPAWEVFKGGLTLYKTLEEVPEWAKKTVEKLLRLGILQGTGQSLELSYDMVRLLVILDRAGVFEKEEDHVH